VRAHFSFTPHADYDVVISAILAHARLDSTIVHRDAGAAGHQLLFCESEEDAAAERCRARTTGRLSPSLCLLDIERYQGEAQGGYRIRVNQDCGEGSRRRMVPFVMWILRTLGPAYAVDDDSGEDLDQVASERPEDLFGSND
jgi:hypothetical protein